MATNDNDANSFNQGKGPHEHESTMSRMLAMGASEMRNPTNVASPSRQKVDDHSIIIALQREMDTLKEKNAQEMKNPTPREQYLKLQEDQNANSVAAIANHQTRLARINEANTTWKEKTPFITQLFHKAINTITQLHPFVDKIMEAQLLPEWKPLTIDRYDGL